MTSSRLRTLVLHASHAPLFSYLDDWADAFASAPEFAATLIDIRHPGARAQLARARNDCDLIVLLHSATSDWLHSLRRLAPLLADRKSPLVAFVGNELNLPGLPLGDKIALLREIGPDFVATQLLEEAGRYLYRGVARRGVVSIPHALNPRAFRTTAGDAERPIDIGSRTASYPAYLGDDERRRLLQLFSTHAFAPALHVDLSTSERFDRAGWAAFLNRCKGTIANEAGSWFLEPDDRTVKAIRQWVLARQGRRGFVLTHDSPLQRLAMLTPQPVRRALRKLLRRGLLTVEVALYDDLPFEPVFERFFRDKPRPPVYAKCISSRHFDAIGTGTCQILVRGRYNDILRPDEHYLALEPDFSNLDEVMRRFRDAGERARVVDGALAHAMAHHTYAHRMQAVAALAAG